MTRDYKNSPKRSARGGGSGKNVFTGILIGLLMGIATALAIALFLNHSPSPFKNSAQQPEPKKIGTIKKPETVKPLESANAPTPPAAPEKPRFDFYEILPGEKDHSKRTVEKAPAKETPAPAKTPTPPAATPASNNLSYYLQAGAFRSSSDADNLKARLALMGLEANVAPAEVANVGTMYRVRLGPYKSSDEVNSRKTHLAQNGIQASVVKLSATQNN
ncbi:MAG: SPOR domain-containing protein [Pseudomonadota bacterium]